MEKKMMDIQALLELLERRDLHALRAALLEENEVDIAEFLEELPQDKIVVVFRALPKEMAAEVFSNLEPDTQQVIIQSATDQEVSAIDMLEELPANVVKRVLKAARPDTRKLINQFLNYPDNSVGSIMTAEFTDLKQSMTVAQAIAHIRRTGENSESVYTCYVTDAGRRLEGVLTIKELLLAQDEQLIADLMETDVITAETTEDQEEAVARMMKYDFISLPVVDKEGRLVGIVTVDDVMDVMEEEATEDFEKMAAMAPSEKPYLKTSVLSLAKHRILWLLVLMISGMITGGMAVGEIQLKDFAKVFWKELRVSMLVGVVLSAVNFVRLIITYPGNQMVALTVALALFVTVLLAKTVGGVLPMVAKLCHADPAIMAAPLITTIVDAISLVVYFRIACALLPI